MQQGLKSLRKFSSPFGVTLSNRDFTSESYRYGFNGMEKDDEAKGAGNSYDFGARIYDSRLGRFLSIDKKYYTFFEHSTYLFAANDPIIYIDFNGDGPQYFIQSITISKTIKANLTKLKSNKICFHDLQSKLDLHANKFFTNVRGSQYIKRRFQESGLTIFLSDFYLADNDYDLKSKYPMPFITAKPEAFETFDAIVTITLVEEGTDGKLVQNTYKLVDPDRQAYLETFYEAAINIKETLLNFNEIMVNGLEAEVAKLEKRADALSIELGGASRDASDGAQDASSEWQSKRLPSRKGGSHHDGDNAFKATRIIIYHQTITRLNEAKEELLKAQNKVSELKSEIKDLKAEQKSNKELKGKTFVK